MAATERLTVQKVKSELDTHLHDHEINLTQNCTMFTTLSLVNTAKAG